MSGYWLVAVGGFIGALARYGVSRIMNRKRASRLPLGTLMVNWLGSCLLGLISALNMPTLALMAGTGFLGAFTTFSTLHNEAVNLWARHSKGICAWYLILTYGPGLMLVYIGYRIGMGVG